jgi:uncharacterized membrane protein YphA (DoxX/SURF4 family)
MAVVALGCRFALALVLVVAGLAKIADTDDFADSIMSFEIVNPRWARRLAAWLPRAELIAGSALLAGALVPFVAAAVGMLLVAFTAVLSRALVRGRSVRCGCFGFAGSRPIGWGSISRNVLLVAAAGTALGYAPAVMSIAPQGALQATSTSDANAIAALTCALAGLLILALATSAMRVSRAALRLRPDAEAWR